jgi:pantetheine-phosphate adenylyltransferase
VGLGSYLDQGRRNPRYPYRAAHVFKVQSSGIFKKVTDKKVDSDEESKDKVDTETTKNKEEKAEFILRGLRNPADFEFEKAIAHTNRRLSKIETVFLLTAAKTSYISSSIVRDVLRNGGDVSAFVPDSVVGKI